MSAAFDRMATVTASSLRPPALSGGQRGEPTPHLAAIACLPIDPVSAGTAQRFGLDAPYTQYETRVDASADHAGGDTLDLRRGDVLVAGGVRYVVSGIQIYEFRDGRFATLLLERDAAGRV